MRGDIHTLAFLPLLAIFALGCPSDTDPKGDTDDTGDTGEPNGDDTFTPEEGSWLFSPGDIIEDTCEFEGEPGEDEEPEDGEFQLEMTGEGTFRIVPVDAEFEVECTLDGQDFTCDEVLLDEEQDPSLDFTISMTMSIYGEFFSSTTMTGFQYMELSCEGTDCGILEQHIGMEFPCHMEGAFDASLL